MAAPARRILAFPVPESLFGVKDAFQPAAQPERGFPLLGGWASILSTTLRLSG
jgi:hypothetical protein